MFWWFFSWIITPTVSHRPTSGLRPSMPEISNSFYILTRVRATWNLVDLLRTLVLHHEQHYGRIKQDISVVTIRVSCTVCTSMHTVTQMLHVHGACCTAFSLQTCTCLPSTVSSSWGMPLSTLYRNQSAIYVLGGMGCPAHWRVHSYTLRVSVNVESVKTTGLKCRIIPLPLPRTFRAYDCGHVAPFCNVWYLCGAQTWWLRRCPHPTRICTNCRYVPIHATKHSRLRADVCKVCGYRSPCSRRKTFYPKQRLARMQGYKGMVCST